MIKLGNVKLVHRIGRRTVVTIGDVDSSVDFVNLKGAQFDFGSSDVEVLLSGYKCWPERQVVDLLFDELKEAPEVGTGAFVVSLVSRN